MTIFNFKGSFSLEERSLIILMETGARRTPRRAELPRWEAGCMFASTPTGEYTVRNGDAAGKVAIATDSHGIPPHGIETIYG